MLQLAAAQARLHSGAPWWLVRDGLTDVPAGRRVRCDIVVIGAGITGALVADALTAAGADVLLIDRRLPASGSTAVCTALLQYELDTELVELIDLIGETDAVRAYQLSMSAMERLEQITASLPDQCDFARRTSIYLASSRRDARRLRVEAEVRNRFGLDTGVWSAEEVRSQFDIRSHGALHTSVAGVVDPVRLARALLARAASRGAGIMPWTTALSMERRGADLVITTDRGVVHADQVVLASGYELPRGLEPSVTSLHGTFAMVTEPVSDLGPLGPEYILWESRRPYTYLRCVDDRVMIGGMDTPFRDEMTRDRLLPDRTRRLERELRRLKPGFYAPTSYAWAGTFGVTRDGLPVIGPMPDIDRVYYAIGYGGNGITFSVLASQILANLCLGQPDEDARLFRPDR
jgi:glycine/D-amino acid oxidase-like deaminating enzyme